MESYSRVFAGATRMAGPIECEAPLPEDWRRARAAHVSLLLVGMPRVNLLLIGIDKFVWNVLESLMPDLREPIITWRAGERLVLPPASRTGTLILHGVDMLASDDQLRLLGWLERAVGRTQVVSTTSAPLLPLVQSGAFIETLYYRLNTVCVDVTA